jgi:dTDP-4-dehydrorhamnose reductase
MFDRLGITIAVVPCKTADFKTAAERPLNSRFDCQKLERLIGRSLPSWQEMLKLYLETL